MTMPMLMPIDANHSIELMVLFGDMLMADTELVEVVLASEEEHNS